jgi:PDZ domain-containing protein
MKRVLTMLFVAITAAAITQTSIPEGSRIYIAPMGGFETNLIAALNEKKVPIVIVGSRSMADFEVAGGAESQKANWMRIWVSGTWRTDEKASIVVKNLHTDVIVYAYEVNKWAAWHGSQSAAEACAKHIKHSMVRLPPEELAGFSASPRAKPDAPQVSEVGATPGGATTDVYIPALGLFARTRADRGAEITEVGRQGLAELSGLHAGDVINSVDGKEVRTSMELAVLVSDRAPGSRIRIGYTFHSSVAEFQAEKAIILQDHVKQN